MKVPAEEPQKVMGPQAPHGLLVYLIPCAKTRD